MILVTGGTGLVGSHLLLNLARSGEKVRATYRTQASLEAVRNIFSYSRTKEEGQHLFNQVEWIKADILDIPALKHAFEGIKKVYHCAAIISFNSSRDSQLRKVNIEGTANIVNYCIHHQVEKLIYVSSIATLDKKPREKTITENSYWNKENDHTMYAITKYGAEMEVWRASQEGVPVVIVNPGIIIGPGFWSNGSGEIFSRVHKGLRYYLPKVTGFVGVHDVVNILRDLMDSSIVNEQFILVSENLSFKRVFEMVAQILEKRAPKKMLTPWIIKVGWMVEKIITPFTGREKKLNHFSSRTLFEDSFYSNQKIIEGIGYKFQSMDQIISNAGQIYTRSSTQDQENHPAK